MAAVKSVSRVSRASPSNAKAELFPITVEMYHDMQAKGILTPEDRCELIEGQLLRRWPVKPPHASATNRLMRWLTLNLPQGWVPNCQTPVTFDTSEPVPDLAIVPDALFERSHPDNADIGLLVEVSDSSLAFDTGRKLSVYARVGIQVYWVVNVPAAKIEVYSEPVLAGTKAKYSRRKIYDIGSRVPIVLGGATVCELPVLELFPSAGAVSSASNPS